MGKVFYLLFIRLIYGRIESALLWYKILSTTLEGIGFEKNPYGRCVENKMIEGTQLKIVWYVDDNKLSHENPVVISNTVNKTKKIFGDISIVIWNKHAFLGMGIEIKDNRI